MHVNPCKGAEKVINSSRNLIAECWGFKTRVYIRKKSNPPNIPLLTTDAALSLNASEITEQMGYTDSLWTHYVYYRGDPSSAYRPSPRLLRVISRNARVSISIVYRACMFR